MSFRVWRVRETGCLCYHALFKDRMWLYHLENFFLICIRSSLSEAAIYFEVSRVLGLINRLISKYENEKLTMSLQKRLKRGGM